MEINSSKYWEGRFSTDWKANAGPEQSRMFAEVAVAMLPKWLKDDAVANRMGLVDVGCAEGDALPVLDAYFGPDVQLKGIDFSATAIESARQKFSAYEFDVGDAKTMDANGTDIVFCSNVLEHFHEPLPILAALADAASHYVVIVVPFWEFTRDVEHFVTFDTASFPLAVAGMTLAYWNVADLSLLPDTRWLGYQAVLVYATGAAIQRNGLNMRDLVRNAYFPGLSTVELLSAAKNDAGIHRVLQLGGAESTSAHEALDNSMATQLSINNAAARQEAIGFALHERLNQLEGRLVALGERQAEDAISASRESALQARLNEVVDRQQITVDSFLQFKDMLALIEDKLSQQAQAINRSAASLEDFSKLGMKIDVMEQENKVMTKSIASLETELTDLKVRYAASEAARRVAEQRLQSIESSRSWRITSPLRNVMRRIRGERAVANALEASGVPVESSMVMAPSVDHRAEFEHILQKHAGRKIIVFRPLVDWDLPLFQRPHHIAARLARQGFLYFYCTPNAYDGIDGFREIEDGLYLTNQFDLVSGLYAEKIVHLYSTDNHCSLDYVRGQQAAHAQIIYEYIDEIDPTISGADIPQHVWDKHNALIADENVICIASADKLYNEVREKRSTNLALVTNGVEYEHFTAPLHTPPPADIADWVKAGKPIVGYFGALATWFDYELVEKCAARYPEVNFLLLGWDYDGTLAKSQFAKYPNIRVVGPIPYKKLPEYARFFDISTIPFKINAVTESTSPIKLFEYMSMGKPIVTTDMPECRKYESVMIGKTHQSYIDLIDVALGRRSDDAYKALLRAEALANTWDAKTKVISDLLA